MTNEEIIMSNRVFLMEEGIISGTGKMFVYVDEKGSREIEIPEEIHTFNAWKNMGFCVKKGEHSIARFPIWQKVKRSKKKGEEESEESNTEDDQNGRYYQKVAFFFTRSQVESITKND